MGDDRLVLITAEPVCLERERGVAIHYRDPDGHRLTYIALPVLVYRLSGSAVLTAAVSALETASYVAVGLFADSFQNQANALHDLVVVVANRFEIIHVGPLVRRAA